jgi:hypothetical protein
MIVARRTGKAVSRDSDLFHRVSGWANDYVMNGVVVDVEV